MKKVEFNINDFAIDNTITLGETYNERLDPELFNFKYVKPKSLPFDKFQHYLKIKHGLNLPDEDKIGYNKYITNIDER